jgi:hypothetical protein
VTPVYRCHTPTWGERYVMELPKRDQKRAKLALDGCSNNK